jgi:hypothetical protein
MGAPISPYQLLGVSPTSSVAEIHEAYRRLALRFHPDISHNPSGAAIMARINDAYESLRPGHDLLPISHVAPNVPGFARRVRPIGPPGTRTSAAARSYADATEVYSHLVPPVYYNGSNTLPVNTEQPISPNAKHIGHIDVHA